MSPIDLGKGCVALLNLNVKGPLFDLPLSSNLRLYKEANNRNEAYRFSVFGLPADEADEAYRFSVF